MFRWSTNEQATRAKRCGRAEHDSPALPELRCGVAYPSESSRWLLLVWLRFVAAMRWSVGEHPACDLGQQAVAMPVCTCVIMRHLAVASSFCPQVALRSQFDFLNIAGSVRLNYNDYRVGDAHLAIHSLSDKIHHAHIRETHTRKVD
jgi:hypothetical protein